MMGAISTLFLTFVCMAWSGTASRLIEIILDLLITAQVKVLCLKHTASTGRIFHIISDTNIYFRVEFFFHL